MKSVDQYTDDDMCWKSEGVVESMNRFYDAHLHNQDIKSHFKSFTDLLDRCEKGGKLLDIGTGTGITSEFCQDFEFHGCDFPHVLAGSAMRNYPHYYYRSCDIVEDNLAWIRKYDVVVANGVIDVMKEGLYILRRILTHANRYVLIHRQELSRKKPTQAVVKPSYNTNTFHSIINRDDLKNLLDEMGFEMVAETSPGFGDWEEGGSSFLLVNKEYNDLDKKKYEYHPLRQLRNRIQATEPRKVIIGAGDVKRDISWIATNEEELNVEVRSDWEFLFGETKADNILGEHLFEHLRFPEVAAKNIYDYLKSGGVALLAVPDGYFPDPNYIDHVKPNGIGAGASDHQWLWNYKTFTACLEGAGFKTKLVEWFTEDGKFHMTEMKPAEGYIGRSRFNDDRNTDTEINFTSLIIRAIKC